MRENMDILERCKKWEQKGDYMKIIDALEKISDRTPEMDNELASAYLALADPDIKGYLNLIRRALDLLAPHEEYFKDDPSWYTRIAVAYFFSEQHGRALKYFKEALKFNPDDEKITYYIKICEDCVAMPMFNEPFKERTKNSWKSFAKIEAKLRRTLDEDKARASGKKVMNQISDAFHQTFNELSLILAEGDEKYELTFSPGNDKARLFELVYFQKHAPKEVLEHWDIQVGRKPIPNARLCDVSGWEISGDDVQVWTRKKDGNILIISVYCEKILPMLKEDKSKAHWVLNTLIDQILGEIPRMRYIDEVKILESPKKSASVLLSQLADKLRKTGLDLSADPEAYLDSYFSYEMEPHEEPESDWRLDVFTGTAFCPSLLLGYLSHNDEYVDNLHADGAAAGFLCYPLNTLWEDGTGKKVFDFREKLEKELTAGDGAENLALIGGATGIYCGYVDFIAWDLVAVLNKAEKFFNETDLPWAVFQTFRHGACAVKLKESPKSDLDDEE